MTPVSGSSLYILGYCKVTVLERLVSFSSARRAKQANTAAHRDVVLLPSFANFDSQVSHHDHAGEACQNHVSILFGKDNHLGKPVVGAKR